jgi:hypothetical protein
MQDEAGALVGAIGLVTLLERVGYVVRTRCREACWEALIRGHGESWYAPGKTAAGAVDAAVQKMVPCELGRVLLRAAIAEGERSQPTSANCTSGKPGTDGGASGSPA